MPECSFCGALEKKKSPLCQSCGALRYPVAKKMADSGINRYKTIKYTASIAAAILTPGSLFVLALIGVNHINTKRNKR